MKLDYVLTAVNENKFIYYRENAIKEYKQIAIVYNIALP
jgi:hypothetical protein